jgi:menaquinone-dependent protoporphyrinogen oxidase
MSRTLILYATTEGHTARIVERIAQRLRDKGHTVETHRADAIPAGVDLTAYDGVMLGASIHYGHHPGYLRALVRRQHAALTSRPSAFFSVSLSASGSGARTKTAQRYLETFLRQVDWHPSQTTAFAGALQYSKYGIFKKLVMRLIAHMVGNDTDTTRDYEYTDWGAVERFAAVFAQRFERT